MRAVRQSVSLTVLFVTAFSSLPVSASTEFSGWHMTEGAGRAQYRWRNYNGDSQIEGCEVEVRNLDSEDRSRYRISIDYYQERNGDGTDENSGVIGHPSVIDISSCDRVKGVFLTRR